MKNKPKTGEWILKRRVNLLLVVNPRNPYCPCRIKTADRLQQSAFCLPKFIAETTAFGDAFSRTPHQNPHVVVPRPDAFLRQQVVSDSHARSELRT